MPTLYTRYTIQNHASVPLQIDLQMHGRVHISAGGQYFTHDRHVPDIIWSKPTGREWIERGLLTISVDYDDGKGHPWEPPPAEPQTKPKTLSRVKLLMGDPE